MGLWEIKTWFKEKKSIEVPVTPVDFSIIVPTRGRYTLLVRLLESILKNTADLNRVEVCLMSDNDDQLTHALVEDYQYYNEMNLILDKQEQNQFINDNYINKGVGLSKGKYLWTLGNDCEILTKDWDLILKRKIEGYLQTKEDRTCYVYINDDMPIDIRKRQCCFPLITRETFDVLGCFMPKEIASYGADHWLWQCFRKVPRINRILDLTDAIFIKHYCSHNNRTVLDKISEVMYRGNAKKHSLTEGEEKNYIQRLIRAIRE